MIGASGFWGRVMTWGGRTGAVRVGGERLDGCCVDGGERRCDVGLGFRVVSNRFGD